MCFQNDHSVSKNHCYFPKCHCIFQKLNKKAISILFIKEYTPLLNVYLCLAWIRIQTFPFKRYFAWWTTLKVSKSSINYKFFNGPISANLEQFQLN